MFVRCSKDNFVGCEGYILRKLAMKVIRLYQRFLSGFFAGSCKFYPSCSQYALDSLEKYGFVRGVYFSIKRLLRCNIFSKGGYDPVK